jgi:hypothetical protein
MARDDEESTAAGIYGVIVGAAVMAASHAATAVALAAAVLVTLAIYWGAERYARLVADRIHSGHRPNRAQVRLELTTGWEIVTASALPLVVLLAVRALGADLDTAVLAALACSTLLLCLAGWEIGRHGHLTRLERIASAAAAGVFGVLFIVLKTVLH